ncbi:polygalacturonase inhibitor-like [Iris pallida]|uniref:Polygalacturonase inhibitor-like n=1 Tax=Iris pallida TaxID=29817 RepID=A0AAX6EJY6_IRIPA|nr:polygalacturonase inhibitor-like [Iris pallida]
MAAARRLLLLGPRRLRQLQRPSRLPLLRERQQHPRVHLPQRLHPFLRRGPLLPRNPQLQADHQPRRPRPSPAVEAEEATVPPDIRHPSLRPRPFLPLPAGSLQQLELGANAFSGAIPPSLGDLARLTDLNMFGNQLTGPIPASLFSKLPIGSLATLVLSANKLTGTIPRSFADVAFTALYLQHNSLNGDASFLFGKSKPLSQIDLASNRLAFDLSRTEFPLNMNVMDISNNKIYGSIPSQITELPNLSFIDVSYNRLCGKIPSGGNVNFSSQSYVHNKCLCGAPLQPCK